MFLQLKVEKRRLLFYILAAVLFTHSGKIKVNAFFFVFLCHLLFMIKAYEKVRLLRQTLKKVQAETGTQKINPTRMAGFIKILKKIFTVWKLISHSVWLRFYRLTGKNKRLQEDSLVMNLFFVTEQFALL